MNLPKNGEVISRHHVSKSRCFSSADGTRIVDEKSPEAGSVLAATPGVKFSEAKLAKFSNVSEFFGTITETYSDGEDRSPAE